MRSILWSLAIAATMFISGCKSAEYTASGRDVASSSLQTVEAGCATCVFDMQGVSGCKLAVRVGGNAYLVSGSDIDDHGDAHAADGMCLAARTAIVEGEVVGDRFVAKSFEVLPSETDAP